MRLGTFRSVLTLWLVICVTGVAAGGTAGAQTNPFTDIGGSYAQQQILDLYARGVISGKGKGLFDPYAPITRAEFVTMMERALGVQPLSSSVPSFHDVSRDFWAYPYVQAGTGLGIVSGTGPDVFQPLISVNRQEVAAFLVRALERNQVGAQAPGELPFADAVRIAPWARLFVAEASRLGLIKGDESGFRPLDPITREETAVVLWRVLQDPRW
ncbi:MAG: S-layer homology domain-containing protein, partial [Tumebacillaceae bacterium]